MARARLPMDSWLEKDVRLRRDIETRGGEKFRKGEVLRVVSHWRGRLYLWDPSTPKQYGAGRRCINHVERDLVEIVEDKK